MFHDKTCVLLCFSSTICKTGVCEPFQFAQLLTLMNYRETVTLVLGEPFYGLYYALGRLFDPHLR